MTSARWLSLRVLLVLAASLILIPTAGASAARTLLSEVAVKTDFCLHCHGTPPEKPPFTPPVEGQIEGPCGLAISPGGGLYVSEYYHRTIDVYSTPSLPPASPAPFQTQLVLPGSNPLFGVNTLDGPCGLAFDGAGNLYVNELHQNVRKGVGGGVIDDGESTGLAVDPTTERLYVNDRTYIAEYALPASPGDAPLQQFATSLNDGFGLAAYEGTVYAADAASGTVKAYRPIEANPDQPMATIEHGFTSLTDSALALDPSNGHLLVVDNAQPGYLHPQSAIFEFGSLAGGSGFLGRLPGAPVVGAPSGIAVTASGQVLVTDGNGELSNVFQYSPYSGASALAAPDEDAGATISGIAADATPRSRVQAAELSPPSVSPQIRHRPKQRKQRPHHDRHRQRRVQR
jgi:DNA-binding beta-propeller fold protein YncE